LVGKGAQTHAPEHWYLHRGGENTEGGKKGINGIGIGLPEETPEELHEIAASQVLIQLQHLGEGEGRNYGGISKKSRRRGEAKRGSTKVGRTTSPKYEGTKGLCKKKTQPKSTPIKLIYLNSGA